MDGIFGFFGEPNEVIFKTMHKFLSHRVGNDIHEIRSNEFSFGFGLSKDRSWQHSTEIGLSQEGDIALAVCGFFTDKKFPITPHTLILRYKKGGVNELCNLRGSFVIALYDRRNGNYLIRDGAGQRIVYFSMLGKRLLFSIEPKGIHQIDSFLRELNPRSLFQYLSFSFIPGVGTMLKGLFKLPAGCYLHWKQNNKPTIHRYFSFERIPKGDFTEKEWVNNFQKQFATCVEDRIAHGNDIGVFLSGGLDSSIVTAQLARQFEGNLHTFSLHFGSTYPNELKFSDAVAKRYSTNHHVFEIRPKQFLRRLVDIIWYLDDPIGDPITVPNYELAQYASKHVDWIFNGEGGDPCFGGPKNYGMLLLHWYGEDNRTKYYQEEAYLKLFKRGYSELDHILSNPFSSMFNREKDLYFSLTPFFNAAMPTGYLDKLMAMNIRLKGENLILPKVDRMLGAHGFYSLSPLFDERMIEFSFSVPSKLKLSGGEEKIILKRAFKQHIPNSIIFRSKEGMRVPLQHWFKNELKSYVRKIFSKEEIDRVGIFNYERMRQLMEYDIKESEPRYGMKLWMLLTFELWRRRVIENEK